ncbi:MAG: PBSX family phage terminase large subunit [Clostridia bacterium]|nr:PBSX family phage terminase large subunit [Clostridia bacterium]
MTKVRIRDIIAPHFYKTFNSKKTNQIYKGGRNSTKSSQIAIKIVNLCLENDNCSSVILRNHKTDLRKSVYKEIKRACSRLGLIEGIDYKATVAPMEIRFFSNGNTIYFAGGDDFEAVKGTIDEDKLIKIVWFEELTGFKDEETIEQIKATFLRGNNDWFIALYSYNPPKNKFHWVNKWCDSKEGLKDWLIHHSDYRTVNPEWVGKIAIQEAEELKKNDEKRYRWIYLGEVIGLEGLIYNPELVEYVDENYIETNKIRILYIDFSTDSGHQTSATTTGAYGFGSDGYWYLLDTYYYSPHEKSNKKAPSELSKDIFNFETTLTKRYRTAMDKETIDSAEGALRNQFFKDFGRRIHPVDKGTNKEQLIDYSQDFLAKKRFRVLNNTNNKIFKKENENYMWVQDSVEKGKPTPDKTEKAFLSSEKYYNTYTKDYAYSYGDHTQDNFQYWIKDNLQKLGLKQ